VGLPGRRVLKFILKKYGISWIQSVQDSFQWEGYFEHRDESSCSITGESLDHMSNYKISKGRCFLITSGNGNGNGWLNNVRVCAHVS
jgi:hypothetical protein